MRKSPLLHLSIRVKLTLPYVLLALLIALGGGIIVTRVMIDSLEDRFTNQLVETRKLASELMVRQESQLLETLRLISHTEGLSTAMLRRDRDRVLELAYPLTFNAQEDVVLVLDRQGTVIVSILQTGQAGEYEFPRIDEKLDALPFVAKLVDREVDAAGDKYSGVSRADWGVYFFVSGPVQNASGELVGVVLVGKSLSDIVQTIREETLAQATLYDAELAPIVTTLIELPDSPAVEPQAILANKASQSLLRDLNVSSLDYTEVLSVWEIRAGENIGFLGTALPKTFLARASRITRWNVALEVILACLAALMLGITLSRRITDPILRLKNAAAEIARGNLNVHVDTDGRDEVAVLAQSFNEMAANLQRSEQNLIYAYDKTIEGWVKALELRDQETLGHTLRAAEITLELARRMQIEETGLENIRRGVLLHDIGKMGIPDNILRKPGPLNSREREIIESHPRLAREMLSQIEFLHPSMDIPTFHHERWDGGGYPDGLAGEQIPIAARLFAIVDVWDALTSDRPYRKAWPQEAVVEHIRSQAGTHFDPRVVEAFLALMEERLGSRSDPQALPDPSMVQA